jgi:hexosaminidase
MNIDKNKVVALTYELEVEGAIRDKATKEQRLQNYVTARMQKFLSDRGRKIIGWDEILEGELAPGATVMSWRGVKGGVQASALGFDVIMTPNTYCYFDYYQS